MKLSIAGAALATTCALLLAGCASSSAGQASSSTPSTTTPATQSGVVKVGTAASMTFLETSKGLAIYEFAIDSPGHSNCDSTCLQYWPAVVAPATLPAHVAGTTATFGVLTRADGTKQLTINGWPAYTYAADTAPGMTNGQGVNASGGLWWLVSPSGQQLSGAAGAPSTAPTKARGY